MVEWQEMIGLKLHEGPSNDGLNIFDVGLPKVDFNTSVHGSKGDGIGLSFIVDDLAPFITRFQSQKLPFSDPVIDHTGMPSISVKDPDGNTVILHGKKPLPGLK